MRNPTFKIGHLPRLCLADDKSVAAARFSLEAQDYLDMEVKVTIRKLGTLPEFEREE